MAVAKKVGTGGWTVYNIFRDHLGTITHLKTGSTITEYSFDAWGRRRDKDDWTYTLTSEPALFADRGFTAHEFLADFNLYNMNGRLYDPVVGRFLSPDPVVQAPNFTQSFNRYSYCLNNPLKYTDPSGKSWKQFWNWVGDRYDQFSNWWSDNLNGVQIGTTISGGQPTTFVSAPVSPGTNVSAGYNWGTGQFGIGNNASGFTGFYYPSENHDPSVNNALQNIADARQVSKGVYFAQVDARLAFPVLELSSPGSVSETYAYDAKGRVNNISETIPGSSAFSTSFTYDSKGRMETRTHPSGIVETNHYNSYGYLDYISAGGATRFTVTAMNERRQVTAATYGSSLSGTFGFDSYGYPTSSATRNGGVYLQNSNYGFDSATGNLAIRVHINNQYTKGESFTYNNLDRLLTVSGPQNLAIDYAGNGNITEKSDVGSIFNYEHPTKPYALTGVETATGLIADDTQTATYTSFEQVNTIAEGAYLATFTYNSSNQRCKMQVTDTGNTILTRWYAGNRYIKETKGATTKQYTWIGGNAYSAPVVAITEGSATNYFYLLRDHLGSVTHLVNTSNTVTAEYNYDAWGRRRDKDDWSYTLSGEPDLLADRGFTGHEYLPWFKLYNMNGRLYDPAVGRFLSADNYVQDPTNSQSYNRYSYCLNNPLRYTDPSGWETSTSAEEEEERIRKEIAELYAEWYGRQFGADGLTNEQWISLGGEGVNSPLYNEFIDANRASSNEFIGGYKITPYGYKSGYYNKKGKFVELTNEVSGYNVERVASGGGDWDVSRLNRWEERSRNNPLITGSYDRYYGLGAKVGGELFGEKAFMGVHIFTVKESMVTRKNTFKTGQGNEPVSYYSGFEIGSGPISFHVIYDWQTGLDIGGSLGILNASSNSAPSVNIVGGYLYGIAGIGGSVDVDLGKAILIASPYNKLYESPGMSYILNQYSDENLKENLNRLDSCLVKINKLNGYRYVWVKDAPMNLKGMDIGVLAQEVEKIIPEAVQIDGRTGYKTVSYYKLIPILIEALKEQQQIIEYQGKVLEDLKCTTSKNEDLINKILLQLKTENN